MTQPIQRDLEVMARLRAALREHDGNVSETARALGVNKGNIHHALHRGTFSATLRRALGLEPWPEWRPRGDLVPRDRLVGVRGGRVTVEAVLAGRTGWHALARLELSA
jgi:hypothetical protein